ncbi:MAG TPA: PIN domain-containing protein [Chloroflexia bacterium]|nr:PIN domain-containing protein [Chloroflexia bacterium]
MIRAFVDSSVLFSACLSTTGASREVLREGAIGNVMLVISEDVVDETERNLLKKRSDALPVLYNLLSFFDIEVVNPTAQEVSEAAQYTMYKDAPIVAAAKKAGTTYLVSLNRRHLVGVPEVSAGSGLSIVLPEELLRQIREGQQS